MKDNIASKLQVFENILQQKRKYHIFHVFCGCWDWELLLRTITKL